MIAGVQARLPLAGGILERMIAIRSAIMLLTHSFLPTSIAPVPPPINPYRDPPPKSLRLKLTNEGCRW